MLFRLSRKTDNNNNADQMTQYSPKESEMVVEEYYEEVDFVLPKRIKIIIGALCLMVVILLTCVTVFVLKYRDQSTFSVSNNVSMEPVRVGTLPEIVSAVSKLMVLPEGEEPTFATVSDPSKLEKQPFFKNASVGDKVLMYTVSKRAILYNPTSNKIVEVGVVVLGDDGTELENETSNEGSGVTLPIQKTVVPVL